MTEQEFLMSSDPAEMLQKVMAVSPRVVNPLGRPLSDGRLRLFACACCRSVWHLLTDLRSRKAVEVAERFADDMATWNELREAYTEANKAAFDNAGSASIAACWVAHYHLDEKAIEFVITWTNGVDHASILRDIIGNPWSTVTVDPAWLTETVRGLAEAAYQCREVKRCDAGCKLKRSLRPDGEWCQWDKSVGRWERCGRCHGTGIIDTGTGTLDPARLAVLSDAVEEAGCPQTTETVCLRCSPYHTDPDNPFGVGPGYHPERDPASGRHEGGWTNCKRCNSGGVGYVRPGVVLDIHPLLAALRSEGPKYRGFWALDAMRGVE